MPKEQLYSEKLVARSRNGTRSIATSAMLSFVMAVLLYFFMEMLVTDLGDELVQSGLPSLDIASQLNYVVWLYIAMALGSSITGAYLATPGPGIMARAAGMAPVTVAILWPMSYIVFSISYPNVVLNMTGYLSLPSLFAIYVVRNVFWFLVIIVAIQTSLFSTTVLLQGLDRAKQRPEKHNYYRV